MLPGPRLFEAQELLNNWGSMQIGPGKNVNTKTSQQRRLSRYVVYYFESGAGEAEAVRASGN